MTDEPVLPDVQGSTDGDASGPRWFSRGVGGIGLIAVTSIRAAIFISVIPGLLSTFRRDGPSDQ